MEFESNLRPRRERSEEALFACERAAPTVSRRMEVQTGYRRVVFSLEQNHRGRYLRIVELAGGRRNSVVIPDSGLGEFQAVLTRLLAGEDWVRG